MKARIYVTLKREVLDPQGDAVRHALGALGFQGVKDVRIGKLVEIELEGETDDARKAQLKSMCEKLLANPVIEDFRVE
ncbi:MAG: phosphoribosylformylglycinamidine synthase subunit PurS [Sandaracinus sp.]